MHVGAATMESGMEILKNVKMDLPFWSIDPTFGNVSEGTQNTNSKEHKHPMFIAALFTITKIWKQPKCPLVDEWIKQPWNIYTMEYYLAVKNKSLPFAIVWNDLENIVLSEISQSEKNKYHMVSLIYGI